MKYYLDFFLYNTPYFYAIYKIRKDHPTFFTPVVILCITLLCILQSALIFQGKTVLSRVLLLYLYVFVFLFLFIEIISQAFVGIDIFKFLYERFFKKKNKK